MNLPKDFIDRTRQLMGEQAEDFLATYDQDAAYGLRINPLKYNGSLNSTNLPFTLTPVPWAKEGFYAVREEHPGKHPLHEGGAYYIQEPSAMSVVSLLDPSPGDIVCDLCAAPGGKSTQIAGRLLGKGLLVSNEIFPARAKILSQNIERLGVGNCVVCNETPDKMAQHFPQFFQKIVVDAPCSGEGMFRKEEAAIQEWSLQQVQLCVERQKMILECADQMLAPGGILVYSTCTFSPDENEQMISWFLEKHSDYLLEDWKSILPPQCGISNGEEPLSQTARLWPNKLQGEGHFAACLRKKGTLDTSQIPQKKKKKNSLEDYEDFQKKYINPHPKNTDYTITDYLKRNHNFVYFKDELYLLPDLMNSLKGLKVIRAGLHLGTRKKNRFEPSHGLAKSLAPDDVFQSYSCTKEEALSYLKGETLSCDSTCKGWVLVCYEGVSLGWGKATNGTIKNHYPKGLRIH